MRGQARSGSGQRLTSAGSARLACRSRSLRSPVGIVADPAVQDVDQRVRGISGCEQVRSLPEYAAQPLRPGGADQGQVRCRARPGRTCSRRAATHRRSVAILSASPGRPAAIRCSIRWSRRYRADSGSSHHAVALPVPLLVGAAAGRPCSHGVEQHLMQLLQAGRTRVPRVGIRG